MKMISTLFKYLIFISLLCSGTTHAQDTAEKVYGKWKTGTHYLESTAISYARTEDDKGNILGVICVANSEICIPYTVTGETCPKETTAYSALVSIDGKKAEAVEQACREFLGNHIFGLPPAHIEKLVTSTKYSIAYATSQGEFKAAYFDLHGSAQAILDALKILSDKDSNTKSKRSQVKDQFLDTEL